MLDLKIIRENPSILDEALTKRGMEPVSEELLKMDRRVRQLQLQLQDLNTKRNDLARKIGSLKQNKEDATIYMQQASDVKNAIPQLEEEIEAGKKFLQDMIDIIPNIPEDDVPLGNDENDNKEIKKVGARPIFHFPPKQHFDIGESLGDMDFSLAANMSGARFVLLKRELALMERALANFMLDIHTNEFGYQEISPPLLVHDSAMYGIGQLPKFEHDSFKVGNNSRLIPTGEVPLTNIVANQLLDEKELPLRFTAYTPCFRSEAGSAGKDTRGMIRLHQFSKVELVSITKPQDSMQEHERMLSAAEEILKRLELPYRIVLLCTGDMGFSAGKTCDLEVWLPGQDRYREISSCSNCSDFQARRLKARYKDTSTGNNHLVHTLNGSALAVGRTIVAILENYQNMDGSVSIPKELQSYMKGINKIGGER